MARRLSDDILAAVQQAYDERDFEVAEALLHVIETLVNRPQITPNGNRRCEESGLVAAHERLWSLRHPQPRG